MFFCFFFSQTLYGWEVNQFPRSYINRQFVHTANEFEWRWNKYLGSQTFSSWNPGCTRETALEEFNRLKALRFSIWYTLPEQWIDFIEVNEDFLFAQELFFHDCYRAGNCLAFAYNNTLPTYNSSNIVVGSDRFLAMEGPRSILEESFFQLLLTYQVSHLVRLTPAFEKQKKCHPYWKGRTDRNAQGDTFLRVPVRGGADYQVRYFEVENWEDHQGIDPERLLELIESVRSSFNPEKDLIACHCSVGVGRTGTFLAAFTLLNEVDRQLESGYSVDELKISIEETVLKLSLQRKYQVARFDQYWTLYLALKHYIHKKRQEFAPAF